MAAYWTLTMVSLRYIPLASPPLCPLHRSPLVRSDRIDRTHDIRDIRAKENEPRSSIVFVEIQDSTVERILKAARRVEARIVYRTADSCRESSLSSFDLATE